MPSTKAVLLQIVIRGIRLSLSCFDGDTQNPVLPELKLERAPI
jgi:hypothetical protein